MSEVTLHEGATKLAESVKTFERKGNLNC